MRFQENSMTKRTILMALLTTGLCHATAILTTQADSCLDSALPANCKTGTGTMTNGGDSNAYAVSAMSFFGILHVSASSTFNVNNGWALALGYVAFTDDLTITSPSHANGTAGKLTLVYSIDGTNTTTGGGHAFLQVVARDYSESDLQNPVVNYVHDFNGSSVNGTFFATPFTFTYGTQFEIYLSMQATAGSVIDSGIGYSTPNVTASGSGASNFFNTLVLTGLQTADGLGNPVGDSVFDSSSHTPYTQAGIAPEPGTWALAVFALPLLWWGARRARNLPATAPAIASDVPWER
jgi:hypothetical protein